MDFTDINTDLTGKFQAKILASTNFENLISLKLDTSTAIAVLSKKHTVLYRCFFTV